MELLERNLESFVVNSKVSLSMMSVLLIVEQMLSRLEQIHQLGVVHRDVKPENFMLKRQQKPLCNELEI